MTRLTTRGPLPARVYWRRRLAGPRLAAAAGLRASPGCSAAAATASSDAEAAQAAAGHDLVGHARGTADPGLPSDTATARAAQPGKHGRPRRRSLAEPDGAVRATRTSRCTPRGRARRGRPRRRPIVAAPAHHQVRGLHLAGLARDADAEDHLRRRRHLVEPECPRAMPDAGRRGPHATPPRRESTWPDATRSDDHCSRADRLGAAGLLPRRAPRPWPASPPTSSSSWRRPTGAGRSPGRRRRTRRRTRRQSGRPAGRRRSLARRPHRRPRSTERARLTPRPGAGRRQRQT